MLPFRGNAHLRQGEERGSSAVRGRKLQKENDPMHAQRVDLDQEAPQTCRIHSRYFLLPTLT